MSFTSFFITHDVHFSSDEKKFWVVMISIRLSWTDDKQWNRSSSRNRSTHSPRVQKMYDWLRISEKWDIRESIKTVADDDHETRESSERRDPCATDIDLLQRPSQKLSQEISERQFFLEAMKKHETLHSKSSVHTPIQLWSTAENCG